MTELKHTPGPWTVGYGETVQFGNVFGVGLNTLPDWTPVCVLSKPGDVNDEDKANARLIAAAPDLLEALQTTLSQCLAWQGEPNEHSCEIHAEIVKHARAAIVKATGNKA